MDNQTPEKPSGKQTEVNVGKDVSDSVIVAGNGNIITVGDKKTQKSTRRKGKSKTADNLNTAIIVAVIGVIGTIIAALLPPLVEKWTEAAPTSTPTISSTPTEFATATEYWTSTPIILVVTSTEIPVTPPTSTFTSTPTFTPTPENTATASFTPEPKAENMTAILQSTVDEGKAPLKVNFDARMSYVQFADKSTAPCGNNPFCSYVFAVYRYSKLERKISNNTGLLSYTLATKGEYFVTVYVCRGEACHDDGVTVTVK